MVIRIIVGALGAGKTAMTIKRLKDNFINRRVYTNIKSDLPFIVELTPEMFFKKGISKFTTNKTTGETKEKFDLAFNIEFWEKLNENIDLVIDEAHAFVNARSFASKQNRILLEFLALARKICGEDSRGQAELTFITHLPSRLDVVIRDMANIIVFCVCFYQKSCLNCGYAWIENSEIPEQKNKCDYCNGIDLSKSNFIIEVLEFAGIQKYENWYISHDSRLIYKHYLIEDIEEYFGHYKTTQWKNLFSKYY